MRYDRCTGVGSPGQWQAEEVEMLQCMLRPSRHQTGFITFPADAGVAGAVILPLTGISVGVVQVVRGALNQPSALTNSSKGLVWDEVSCIG